MKSIARISGMLFLLLVGIAAGCAPYKTPAAPPKEMNHVSLSASDWYFFNGGETGRQPSADTDSDAAWSFYFGPTDVHYLQTPFQSTYVPGRMSMTFKVVSHDPVYVVTDPTDHLPATVRMFFEQQGDDLRNPDGRWWASGTVYNLGSQDGDTITFLVDFGPEKWNNVYGQNGATRPTQFNAALANIGWVGMTFGGQYFAGHGVSLNSGTARFILKDFYVI
jgi:hypothetical protein